MAEGYPLRMMPVTVIPYLNNFLFIDRSSQQLVMDLQKSQGFLQSLDWLINRDQSHLVPSQEVV